MITDNTKKPLLAGVIGHPIDHSKSPKLHNYWLSTHNINGFYIPLDIKPQDLTKSIESLVMLGFRGVNVTIPHKVSVLSIADTATDRASMIGAANTLYFNKDGKVTADNTDGYGFKQNIKSVDPMWNAKVGPAVVFGAGGAAKAVIHSLLSEGVPLVRILNRTRIKAEMIAENLGNRVEVIDWYAIKEALNGATTIINTTSLGMLGQPTFEPDLSNVSSDARVIDLVYNPIETDFLKIAKKCGLKTIDGIGMLFFQAEPGFKNWFNAAPVVDEKLRALFLNE